MVNHFQLQLSKGVKTKEPTYLVPLKEDIEVQVNTIPMEVQEFLEELKGAYAT